MHVLHSGIHQLLRQMHKLTAAGPQKRRFNRAIRIDLFQRMGIGRHLAHQTFWHLFGRFRNNRIGFEIHGQHMGICDDQPVNRAMQPSFPQMCG